MEWTQSSKASLRFFELLLIPAAEFACACSPEKTVKQDLFVKKGAPE
jgi:hypothetical protein